jgi:hypothetical protein
LKSENSPRFTISRSDRTETDKTSHEKAQMESGCYWERDAPARRSVRSTLNPNFLTL